MTLARSFTVAAAVLFATLSVASSSIIKQKSDGKSCSCDCCEVQSHPVMGLQCAYSQTSIFKSTASKCGTLCKQDAEVSLLEGGAATAARETDTERYCFSECQPKPPIDTTLLPKPGDSCKRFPKAMDGALASGNAVPERPNNFKMPTKAHFLVSKRKHVEVAAVAIAGRVENGAVDLAGFVAGPAPAAVIAAAPGIANEAESAALAPAPVLVVAPVAPAPAPAAVAPAPAPAPAAAAKPPAPVPKWASVSPAVNQQVVAVVTWATEAQAAAAKSQADAAKITIAGTKAGSSMTTVLAEVGNAKAAMYIAEANEKKMTLLYDRMFQKAKSAALAEVPAILLALRVPAQAEADKKARAKAKVFEKAMKAKGMAMSLKAAKVYTDQMTAAGKSAAAYAKLGDGLIGQSATAQVNAQLAAGGANAMMMTGQVGEAQKMYQTSRTDMNTALALNAQATKMYDTANTITVQMPTFAGQAAQASFHAQVMYDPKAVAPPPPLV